MKLRLFVAADLDDAAREACAAVAGRLRARGWPGRFITAANYHLTVAFLGAVDEERLGDVRAALNDVVPRVPRFSLALERVGAFPTEQRPRVAWVGPAAAAPAFGTLCGVVRSALVAYGFTFDERADAHVTLARSDGSAALPHVTIPAIVPLAIDALTLYASHREPAGARYEPLGRVALGAAGTVVR